MKVKPSPHNRYIKKRKKKNKNPLNKIHIPKATKMLIYNFLQEMCYYTTLNSNSKDMSTSIKVNKVSIKHKINHGRN